MAWEKNLYQFERFKPLTVNFHKYGGQENSAVSMLFSHIFFTFPQKFTPPTIFFDNFFKNRFVKNPDIEKNSIAILNVLIP